MMIIYNLFINNLLLQSTLGKLDFSISRTHLVYLVGFESSSMLT